MPFGWGGKSGPTPAQKQVGEVLFNDSLHVLSSFELNRIASLTYGEIVCDEIFEMLEEVQRRPMEHSVLTVQKSLVITRHVLVYGSEKCVNSALALHRCVEMLLEFNTVIWAQKLQGAAAVMHRLKGGGVDKGYPVREAAKAVWPLMTDVTMLRNLRNSSADPNSLVPVGNDKVAFLSDDVRHYLLKKRIKEQYEIQIKSNLIQDAGGFGSGYTSKDGKTVVGAAHGLEEMIKQAQRASNRFSDDGKTEKYDIPDLAELAMLGLNGNTATTNTHSAVMSAQQSPAAVGDLLDFTREAPAQASNSFETDLFGTGGLDPSTTADLLGTSSSVSHTADLLGTSSSSRAASGTIDIFDSLASTSAMPGSNGLLDLYGIAVSTNTPDASGLSGELSRLRLGADTAQSISETCGPTVKSPSTATEMSSAPPKTLVSTSPKDLVSSSIMASSVMGGSIMTANEDRFSALDALEVPAMKNASMILSAKEAQNRLLSQSSGADTPVVVVSSLPDSLRATNPPPSTPSETSPYTAMGMVPGIPTNSSDAPEISLASLQTPVHFHSMEYPTISSYGGPGIKVAPAMSSLNVSATFGDPHADDDDDGFLMGGAMGTGLEPTAAAPAAPPPPPPPI